MDSCNSDLFFERVGTMPEASFEKWFLHGSSTWRN